MADTGTRVSAMANCRFWMITSPPPSGTLLCSQKTRTPLMDMLDVWPAFPLFIHDAVINTKELDNTIAVLERSDRVYHIILTSSYMENILATMLKPFPELTYLGLVSFGAATVIPDSFLGGSAPRLQSFSLHGILFPGLPNLLLSAPHLVNLSLSNIPRSGYISPEGIVTALSPLTSLRRLSLTFESPRSFPDRRSRHPPPLTRSVLPALRALIFKGLREYLEDLVALIDAPRLCFLSMTLFNQIFFNTPQSIHFFCRTTRLKAFKIACLVFKDDGAAVVLSPAPEGTSFAKLEVKFLYRDPVLQVLSVEQVCITCLPPLPALEDLYIYEDSRSPPDWRDNVENTRWLDLLRQFPAVKNLYLSEEFALRIRPALQELVESRTMELLRNLQNIFVEGLQPSGLVQEGIVKFVAARRHSGHHIIVSLWEIDRASLDIEQVWLQEVDG